MPFSFLLRISNFPTNSPTDAWPNRITDGIWSMLYLSDSRHSNYPRTNHKPDQPFLLISVPPRPIGPHSANQTPWPPATRVKQTTSPQSEPHLHVAVGVQAVVEEGAGGVRVVGFPCHPHVEEPNPRVQLLANVQLLCRERTTVSKI